jgi:hypothetical protein
VQQEILEVFVEAVRQVFRETDIAIESVDAGDVPEAEDNVIASVGLTGDLKGIFMLRTDTPSAANFLKAMTGGLRLTLRDDLLNEIQMAALGELSNQCTMLEIQENPDKELGPRLGFSLSKGKGKSDDGTVGGGEDQEDLDDDFDDYEDDLEEDYDEEEVSEEEEDFDEDIDEDFEEDEEEEEEEDEELDDEEEDEEEDYDEEDYLDEDEFDVDEDLDYEDFDQ